MARKKVVETKRDPMVEFVSGQFEVYKEFHQARFDEAKDIVDYWSNKPPKRDEDWMNAVAVPMTVEAEQTITPRLFSALFPNDAPVEVQVEGNADRMQGSVIKHTIQHYFRVGDFQGESHPAISQCTLLGTAYVETGSWFVRLSNSPDGTTYLAESRPNARFVDFFDMFPHPGKRCVEDGLPIIRKQDIDAEALKKYADAMKIDNMQEALESDHPEDCGTKDKSPLGKKYEVLQYWGPWDKTFDTTDEDGNKATERKAVQHWIIVVNRKVLLRGDTNPYNHQLPPYCRIKLFPDIKPSWFGVGVGKIGAPTQERLNKMVNQRLDNVDLVLQKQCMYNAQDPNINKKKLRVAKPGQAHGVADTTTSIKWMDTPDVTQSSYKEEEIAKADYRQATGAAAPIVPTEGTQHRTAMGINMLQNAAGMRFLPVLKSMENDLVAMSAYFYLINLQQFMSQAEWIQMTSDGGEQFPWMVTPQQIQAKAEFIPTGVTEAQNREVEVGQLLRFKELTVNDPTVNRQEINRRIAELFGFKDIQKLLTNIQQPQGGGPLSANEQLAIQQRIQEGASPDQIKQEMLGNTPQPEPMV